MPVLRLQMMEPTQGVSFICLFVYLASHLEIMGYSGRIQRLKAELISGEGSGLSPG